MIEQLRKRGYGYGSGVLSPDARQFIVNIPKNASSYILDWASRHKWTAAEILEHPRRNDVQEVIVVLRDPVNRWISGIGQYLTSYVLNVTGAYSWETGPGPHDQFMPGDEFITNYILRFFPYHKKRNILNTVELATLFHFPDQRQRRFQRLQHFPA